MTTAPEVITAPARRRLRTGGRRWRPDRAGAPVVLALVLIGGSLVFGDHPALVYPLV